jgi:hypothetical protein
MRREVEVGGDGSEIKSLRKTMSGYGDKYFWIEPLRHAVALFQGEQGIASRSDVNMEKC